MVWVNPKSNYFAMGTFGMRLFGAVILLFCCGVFQNGQAADGEVFGLCDVGDVISARNGSLVPSKGKDCTRVILAPRGWRIKFTLYEITMFDAVTSLHDGGTVVGTLKQSYSAGHAVGGSGPLVFYTSSNALVVHTDQSSSNDNKFNATFEMLPHLPDKCACPPTVNAQTVCSFKQEDQFYHDTLHKKTCTTSCESKHGTVVYGTSSYSLSSVTMACTETLKKPDPVWAADIDPPSEFDPNLVSCTKVLPVTEVFSVYKFEYSNVPCVKLNKTAIENEVSLFLVNNMSALYVGECYKKPFGNCTVLKPVLVTCSASNNPNNSIVVMNVQDNIEMGENETMTSKLFDILYDDVSSNLKDKLQRYVTNDLVVNNATAMNFQLIGDHTSCPTNHVSTGQGRKSCISCPLHTYKHSFPRFYFSTCQKCPSNQRRLLNESMCVNGTQVYPKPSNTHCLHKCALGKFFNNVSGLCEWCDYGFFQNSTTALNPICQQCAAGNTTAFVGARHEKYCMYKCRKGQFAKFPSCFDCDIGYYMPYEGNRFAKCYKCPTGNTTLNVGTANETGCVDQCTLGEYFNITLGICVVCPNNTYENEKKPSNTRSCKTCPTNSVTLSTGAMSITACLGPCSAGEYLDVKLLRCKKCPVNTYNDESNQTYFICKQCPKHKITLQEGSNNISQCIYTCSKGEFFNLTSKTCEKCLNNTYQDNIGQSSCKKCNGNMFTLKPGSKTCIAPCNLGEFLNKSAEACQNCSVGYFQNETNYVSAMCLPCPLDYYTHTLGSRGCTACPNGEITILTAAKGMSECIERCGRGYYLNKTLQSCEKCSKGFYQDQQGYRYELCVKCASANLTTLESGAKSAEECVGYCESLPCLNGAKCTNIENDFNCTCPKHLAGKQCQTIIDSKIADTMKISVQFTKLVWDNNLSDPDSREFMELANQIENAIRGEFKNDTTLRTVKVDKFTRGSVISDLEFNYVAGTEFNNPLDTLTSVVADGKIGNLTVNSSSLDIVGYTCGTPLGMENGRIPDSAITSANRDNYHPFKNARLNHNGPGWTPRVYHIEDAYLQVDFGEVVQLTGIATQGSSYQGGNWLQAYHFNYSIDEKKWLEYKEGSNGPKVCFGYLSYCCNINLVKPLIGHLTKSIL